MRGRGNWSRNDDNGSSSSVRSRWLRWLAPSLCLVVVVLALMIGSQILSGEMTPSTGDSAADSSVEDVAAGQDATGAEDESDGSASDDETTVDITEGTGASAEEAQDAGSSAAEVALAELDRRALSDEEQAGDVVDGDDEEASIELTYNTDLVEAAEDVLEAYRDITTTRLRTAGYLDLKGNAWGALVQDERGWVDIVVVSTQDDETSTVNIVRLCSETSGEDENDGEADEVP